MDGSPEVGKIIPIRLYLNGIAGLSPSFSSLHDRLSISYSLKLMIVDYLGKKYFKEAPITLYRYLK
jgi:vacuolar protein sorting-associated protein 26